MSGEITFLGWALFRYDVVDYYFYDHGEMGKQLVLRFGNGYGLSICSEAKEFRRYASDSSNLWEVGITRYHGDGIDDWKLQDVSVNPNSPHTNDTSVYGWQNAEQIENLIRVWSAFEG